MLATSIVLLSVQIFLGGWTSSNYAALSCGEYFPTCMGELWPDNMDFKNAFFWGSLGIDYEFGVLESQARSAIQMLHRIGALVVALTLAFLIVNFKNYSMLKNNLLLILTLLVTQVVLGIMNVVLSLPMLVAVLHNAFALGLLLSLISLLHKIVNNSKA
jgi:cytochrome c oxidase assembly protein subunit 15